MNGWRGAGSRVFDERGYKIVGWIGWKDACRSMVSLSGDFGSSAWHSVGFKLDGRQRERLISGAIRYRRARLVLSWFLRLSLLCGKSSLYFWSFCPSLVLSGLYSLLFLLFGSMVSSGLSPRKKNLSCTPFLFFSCLTGHLPRYGGMSPERQ